MRCLTERGRYMHISWNFLNKRNATIKAIQAFNSMDFIIHHTDDEIVAVRTKMEGVGSQNLDGLPHAQNPQAAEERTINSIEEIDTLKERYRQAVEYMTWFKPAWDQLAEDDRYVLEAFFMGDDENGAGDEVADYFQIERASAYRKKNRALDRLTSLLYGKC